MDLESYKAVVNQAGPIEGVSSRYKFVPTTTALSVLADHGWRPATVLQARVRLEDKDGYQSHVVRLRNEEYSQLINGKEYYPEIILKNSHNRGAAFELGLGIWRQVCGNGLIATTSYGSHKIRHVGFATSLVEEAVQSLAGMAGKMLDAVELYRSIQMSPVEQIEYAQRAIEMKFDAAEDKFVMEPRAVLTARRWADRDNDLWSTFNRVQENLIKGGAIGRNANGHRRRDRAVNNIQRNINLNRDLWNLTDEFSGRDTVITLDA